MRRISIALMLFLSVAAHAQAPPALPSGNNGVAAAYPNDTGISGNANVLFADGFETYTTNGQLTSSGNWSNFFQSGNIAFDTAQFFGGTKSIRLRMPSTGVEVSNAIVKAISPSRDTLFMRVYTRFQSTYAGMNSAHNGLRVTANYTGPGVRPNGTDFFLVNVENSGAGPEAEPGYTHAYVYHPEQDDVFGESWYSDGTVTNGTANFGAFFTPRTKVVPPRGSWVAYEVMVKANTPGVRDGRVAMWQDGVLMADWQNVRFRDVGTVKINEIQIENGGQGSTQSNDKWYDNLVIATSYIGPMATTPAPPQPVVSWSEWGPAWGRAGLDVSRYNEPGMMKPQPGDIDNNTQELGRGMIEWRSVTAAVDGTLDFLSPSLFPRVAQSRPLSDYEYAGMVEHLHTYIKASDVSSTSAVIAATSNPFPADIWLNGTSITSGTTITLVPGWNRLMVKSRSPHGASGQVWASTPWNLKVTVDAPVTLQFRTTDPERIVKVTDTGKAFRYGSKVLRTDADQSVITAGPSISLNYTMQAGVGNDVSFQDLTVRATTKFSVAPWVYSVDPTLIPQGNVTWQVVPEATWPAALPTKTSIKVLDDKGQTTLQQQFPLTFGAIVGGLVTANVPLNFGALGVGNYVIKADLVDNSNNVLVRDNDHSFAVVAPVPNRALDQKPRILGVVGHHVSFHDYGKAFRWMSRVGIWRHHKISQSWGRWVGSGTPFDAAGNFTVSPTTVNDTVVQTANALGIGVIGDALEGYYIALSNNLENAEHYAGFPAFGTAAWDNVFFNYGQKLAQHYTTITTWGGMNELEASGPTTSPAADQYVAAARKIKAGLLAGNPASKYTSSSTYTNFTNLWNAGFLTDPDIVDVHAHPFRAPEPSESSITPYTVQGRQLLINLGYTGPVNYGEMSAPRAHSPRGARGQAEDVVKQIAWGINYRDAATAPVVGLDYLVAYESPDYTGGQQGFGNQYGDPLPAANAASTASRLLDGRNLMAPLTGLPAGISHIRVTGTDPAYPETIAIWKSASPAASVPLPVAGPGVKVVDLMGRETFQATLAGQVTLAVTTTPQFVEVAAAVANPDLKKSIALRSAEVNSIEPNVGPSPILRLCGGPQPASVGAADGGIAYVTMTLPTDWITPATAGVASKTAELWQGIARVSGLPGAGGITHFRIYAAGGTTPKIQGSVTATGGGGVITTEPVIKDKAVRITDFSITASNIAGPTVGVNRMLLSSDLQDDLADALKLTLGPSPVLKLLTGAMPASIEASDPGSAVATMNLPAAPFSGPVAGVLNKAGTWQDTSADSTGVITHARLFDSSGTPHVQIDAGGVGGSLVPSTVNVTAGDNVTVPTFVYRAAGQ